MPPELENPWAQLPKEAPFLLPHDAALIEGFNLTAEDCFKVRAEIIPEPFLGNPDAPIVLLSHNPGFDEENDLPHHGDPNFAILSRANLLHKPINFPLYLLDPTIARTKYWEGKLRWLIERFDIPTVAHSVFCVEFFPYHSERFDRTIGVPSQQYSFSLVKQAITRGAVILILRGERD